jgi:hypothetical protein
MGGDERLGVTSRIRPAAGRKRIWQIDDKVSFSLPVVVDHMYVDPATHQLGYHIQATIDLVEGEPALTRIDVRAPQGIDVVRMQREFRWASPLEIVRRTIPILLGRGIDPFAFDLPLTGYPAAAELGSPSNAPLTDAFLETIARQYLTIGRGYAKAIAKERQVSPRTVVSWVEKARRRGILTRVPAGGFGGQIVPKGRRRPS